MERGQMEIIEMENRWKDSRWKSIEMKDKWKDHGWKAWKWSVTRLTLHSAKPELAKVAKVASSFRQPEFIIYLVKLQNQSWEKWIPIYPVKLNAYKNFTAVRILQSPAYGF